MKRTSLLILAATGVLMAGCGAVTADKAAGKTAVKIEVPPCVPTNGILPGKCFSPEVDVVRAAAISDLLVKIANCTPLPYEHDAIIFSNREGLLPQQPKGYYREYSLPIPGRRIGDAPQQVLVGTQPFVTGDITSPRGAERLVIGGGRQIFYTPDHYVHFIELQIVR